MLKRLRTEERGISAVIVVVSLIAVFGAAMLSVDAGNMWQTRRNIISGTDSTVLDQAKYLAFASDKSTCEVTWTDYMVRNSGGGTGVNPISCTTHPLTNGTGYVAVEGSKEARTRFGGLFGIGNTQPYSLSAAQWGYANEVKGLRPMGICSVNDHIEEWIAYKNGTMSEADYLALKGNPAADHPVYAGAGVVHRLFFTKDNPDDCGSDAPGNWGWMDFECNNDGDTPSSICGNTNDALKDLIRYGYQEPVGITDCDADSDQGGEANDYCNGDTGSSGGSVGDALNDLVTNETEFAIPIFDDVTVTSGNNVYFNMKYFVGVILRGYKVTGPESDRYFDFEFINLVTSGTCCASSVPAVDTGIRVVKLCNVDHDTSGLTIEKRCGQA